MPKVPYPYEVNWHLVTGNGSLTPICSLSKRSLSPSLTVPTNQFEGLYLLRTCGTYNWREQKAVIIKLTIPF